MKKTKEQRVREQRGQLYGDPTPQHRDIGIIWTGILQSYYREHDLELPEPIPSHVVCLMMAALKIERAALPFKFSEDDYVDAKNYLDFSAEGDQAV